MKRKFDESRGAMDGHIQLHIIEWRGRWHWYAVLVLPTPRSKVARRIHVASDTTQGDGYVSERECFQRAADWLLWRAENRAQG